MLNDALRRTDEILNSTGWGVAASVKKQLEFMQECLRDDRRPTAEELVRINIGLLGVRNIEDSDPEYAHWLSELDYAFTQNWKNLT